MTKNNYSIIIFSFESFYRIHLFVKLVLAGRTCSVYICMRGFIRYSGGAM